MALKLRRTSASRVRLLSTLIAVFALLAQPMYGFVASQVANAAAGRSETVRTASELLAAAGEQDISTIKLGANISLEPSERLIFSGRAGTTLVLDGKGYTLSMINNPAGWNKNDENYVIQAYKSSVKVQDITISGGDAAILVNGATVELNNSVNVSNNTFGGIEVSQGVGVTTPAILKGTSNLVLANNTEANGQPTAWIDKANVVHPNTAVKISKLKETTHIGNNQKQYYLSLGNSNTVATNTTKHVTYDNLQTAFDLAATGDTVELNKSVSIAAGQKAVIIKKDITFDGNGNSIATLGNRGSAGDNKNAALIVVGGATGATIKNVVIEGNGSGTTASHGIVVDRALSDVVIDNITAKNNAAGVIINSANVTIKNIHTINNNWYGINVDGKYGHATLSISGENTHSDFTKPAIFSENGTTVMLVDENDQYNQILPEAQVMRAWYLKSDAPATPNVLLKDAKDKTITNGYISTENFTFNLSSENATTYKIEYWNNIEESAYNGRANAWPTTRGDNGIYSDRFSQGEGKHYFAFSACNAIGNCSAFSAPFEVTYDKTVPKDFEATAQGESVSDKQMRGVVEFKVSQNESHPDKMYIEYQHLVNGKPKKYAGDYTYGSNTGSLTVDTKKWESGNYQLKVSSWDKAGNNSSKTFQFTIDNNPPAAPTIVAQNVTDNIIKGNQEFSITAEPKAKIIAKYGAVDLVKIDDNLYTLDTSTIPYGTEVTITAQATDEAGNESPVTSLTYTVQNDGPAISNVKVSSDRPSFSQTVTGSVLPATGVKVTVMANGKVYPAIVSLNGKWSAEIDVRSYTAGRYNFIVRAVDQFNNSTETTTSYAFNVAPPVTPPIDPQNNFGPVANPARIFNASNVIATPALVADEDVLGASDTKTASPEKTVAVIEPSAQGWKLFGFAWFWWVLLGAAIAAGWWMIAAARRRRDDAAY